MEVVETLNIISEEINERNNFIDEGFLKQKTFDEDCEKEEKFIREETKEDYLNPDVILNNNKLENQDLTYHTLKETSTGITFNMNKDDVKVWEKTLSEYFDSSSIYSIDLKNTLNSSYIGVKNATFKKKDFTITIYKTTGTIMVQTKKREEFLQHMENITVQTNSNPTNTVASHETYTPDVPEVTDATNETMRNVKYKITKDDQVIISENFENSIVNILDKIAIQNERIVEMSKLITEIKTENKELKTKINDNNVAGSEWLNVRYEFLRNIPVILKENSSLKLKLGKLSEDINIVNIRVNILEKKLKDNKMNVEQETKDKNNELNHIKKLILKTNNANDRIHNNEDKIKDIEKSVQWNAESEDINVNSRKRLEVIENISKDNAASLLIIQKERRTEQAI